MFLRISEAKSY